MPSRKIEQKICGFTGANVISLATVGRQFLERVDELDLDTLPPATPALVKMLQRYDRLLGLRPSPDSSCGIDVRLIFVCRKRFQELGAKEQHRWMKGAKEFFFDPRQLQAIVQPLRPIEKCSLEEIERLPLALMPVVRGRKWKGGSREKKQTNHKA